MQTDYKNTTFYCFFLILYLFIHNLVFAETEQTNAILIDVRSAEEFTTGHLQSAINIDIHSPNFMQKINTMPKAGRYYIYCRSGNRSQQALKLMQQSGFTGVKNIGSLDEAATYTQLEIVTNINQP